jgi:hypothetical protein
LAARTARGKSCGRCISFMISRNIDCPWYANTNDAAEPKRASLETSAPPSPEEDDDGPGGHIVVKPSVLAVAAAAGWSPPSGSVLGSAAAAGTAEVLSVARMITMQSTTTASETRAACRSPCSVRICAVHRQRTHGRHRQTYR